MGGKPRKSYYVKASDRYPTGWVILERYPDIHGTSRCKYAERVGKHVVVGMGHWVAREGWTGLRRAVLSEADVRELAVMFQSCVCGNPIREGQRFCGAACSAEHEIDAALHAFATQKAII